MTNPFEQQVKIGILGGGQLGRMMLQSSIDFDLDIACMDPNPEAPCHQLASSFVKGNFQEYQQVVNFGRDKDILTIEIEHVNTDALKYLVSQGVQVYPSPDMLELIQDKGAQKQFYQDKGIPASDFVLLDNAAQAKEYASFLPAVQKTRRAGYDGQGVQVIDTEQDLGKAFDVPSVLEKKVDFSTELSVIVARTPSGTSITFPPVEMDFNSTANLVEFLYSPAQIDNNTAQKAASIATDVAEKMQIVGLLAVEMFLTKDGDILVNEVAPRPHNTGHHTIEGNITSQFEQHLRAILDLPLGDTSIVQPAVMVNLLGAVGHEGPAKYDGIDKILAMKGAHVHLYGKKKTRPFRKMGHVTVVASDLATAKDNAKYIQDTVKVIS
ncbi:MAG: 5-(carboxyamino)imidazole ribonucleotide synthase [Bacteroidetes bacterium SW_11_45_7]|nr:MAG: 5-(carboxyamino)imidazole ribonucleotide synthase [Bacteroidetes bacterium SW_11_45_7]